MYSITRDNASSNNTLIASFSRAYTIAATKFEGNIACCAHVLNLAIQDILKSIIKSTKGENTSFNDLDAIQAIEEEEEELQDQSISTISKSLSYSNYIYIY
jgi:hypothetical protein